MTILVVSAFLLSLERVTYAWVYHRPAAFAAAVARSRPLRNLGPAQSLALCFLAFKAVQLGVFAWWCWSFGSGAPLLPVDGAVRLIAVAAGAVLVIVGQVLNLRVFQLLGPTGVFYGNRFGLTLRWCQAFPFSMLSHPQYVGACLSIWGLFLVMRCPSGDWYILPLLETAYYMIGANVER